MAFNLTKASRTETSPPLLPWPSVDQGPHCWSSLSQAPMTCYSHLDTILTLSPTLPVLIRPITWVTMATPSALLFSALLPFYSCLTQGSSLVLCMITGKGLPFALHILYRGRDLSCSWLHTELLDDYLANRRCILTTG